ncbi:hypothetical protein SCHAM137S_02264 [Streptomyces chartreusis]
MPATKLVKKLVEAADDKQLSKTIARYGRVDLLCINELGYMELDRRGAELLFQVLTEREEKNSVAIASNESFSGWTQTFTDPRLCAAIVDRLTFNGAIIQTSTVLPPCPYEPRPAERAQPARTSSAVNGVFAIASSSVAVLLPSTGAGVFISQAAVSASVAGGMTSKVRKPLR